MSEKHFNRQLFVAPKKRPISESFFRGTARSAPPLKSLPRTKQKHRCNFWRESVLLPSVPSNICSNSRAVTRSLKFFFIFWSHSVAVDERWYAEQFRRFKNQLLLVAVYRVASNDIEQNPSPNCPEENSRAGAESIRLRDQEGHFIFGIDGCRSEQTQKARNVWTCIPMSSNTTKEHYKPCAHQRSRALCPMAAKVWCANSERRQPRAHGRSRALCPMTAKVWCANTERRIPRAYMAASGEYDQRALRRGE